MTYLVVILVIAVIAGVGFGCWTKILLLLKLNEEENDESYSQKITINSQDSHGEDSSQD